MCRVWGGYAQYVCLPAANTHLIPGGLNFDAATIVARHAPLAFNLLTETAKVAAGEWILIMGAAGGLGSAGVQVAKYLGANVIAAAGADKGWRPPRHSVRISASIIAAPICR